MAGLDDPSTSVQEQDSTFSRNLAFAAEQLAPASCCIEPINTRSIPGYFLRDVPHARRLIESVDPELHAVQLQFDYFHLQIIHGDVTTLASESADIIGHVQISSVPERNEPDMGELNFPFVCDRLDAMGYDGWVGAEYNPAGRTEEGLGWFRPGQQARRAAL